MVIGACGGDEKPTKLGFLERYGLRPSVRQKQRRRTEQARRLNDLLKGGAAFIDGAGQRTSGEESGIESLRRRG